MAPEQKGIENNAPDDAAEWYSSRRADNLRQVESSLNQLADGYQSLDARWSQLAALEEQGHEELNTRLLLHVERERAQLQQQAAQIQNGWDNLQIEKHKIEQSSDPQFSEILESSSQPAQMFLRAHRNQLENDPNALRQLMFADARAKAVGLKPDSANYFKALEASMGFSADDRSLDDFSELSETSPNTYKVERKDKSRATPEQRVMARNLPGVTEDEYLKSCAQPFSQAAQTVSLEPDELNLGQSKGMEVSLNETPKKTIDHSKYKPSKQSMTLSAAQVKLCEAMGVDPKDYVKNFLKVKNGETTHQWYEQRLKSQGLA